MFNVSDKLKTGLWKVVTLTKLLTATILYRGCEQLPACQCLTEIIAVPTGSFGRQMAGAVPFICQQPFHNSHCPVGPGWEGECRLANHPSSLDTVGLKTVPLQYLEYCCSSTLAPTPGVSGTFRKSKAPKPKSFMFARWSYCFHFFNSILFFLFQFKKGVTHLLYLLLP